MNPPSFSSLLFEKTNCPIENILKRGVICVLFLESFKKVSSVVAYTNIRYWVSTVLVIRQQIYYTYWLNPKAFLAQFFDIIAKSNQLSIANNISSYEQDSLDKYPFLDAF